MADQRTTQPRPYAVASGMIIDVVAATRQYLVQCGAMTPRYCVALSSRGGGATVGPGEIGMYSPGDAVIVFIDTSETTPANETSASQTLVSRGYILGAYPPVIAESASRATDWVSPPIGMDTIKALHQQYSLIMHRLAPDSNNNKPLDAFPGSDSGVINETGVGEGISRFFAWMRASDMAGVWCHYLDNLTRIAAYNYEFWHSGGERSIKNDSGEVNDIDFFTPYPWEALGVSSPTAQPFIENTKQDRPGLQYEPIYPDQQGLFRRAKIRGYLGDLEHDFVMAPPSVLTPAQAPTKLDMLGLSDVHRGIDGSITNRSARSIVSEKYIYIPVPKQIQVPESTKGDQLPGYTPAGLDDESGKHARVEWRWSNPDKPDLWAAELYDYQSYMLNWYGIKPLLAHSLDWYIPNEGEFGTIDAGISGVYVPTEVMGDQYRLPMPQFTDVEIDHRGKARYYYTRSIIAQLPDGSVLIEDGYGSQIHMSGGNITTTCAGDVFHRPGRSFVVWAGDDAVVKAGSSVDITASMSDVRVKAERNLHMLGGNSGVDGGVIIESRSVYGVGGEYRFRDENDNPLVGEDVATYGVIVKTMQAPVMVYGRNVHVEAVSEQVDGGDSVGGTITAIAGKDMVMSSNGLLTRFAKDGYVDIIGQELKDGTAVLGTSVVNRFSKVSTVLGATDLFRASASNVVFDTIGGNIYMRGALAAAGGVIPFPSGQISGVITSLSTEYNTWVATGLPTAMGYYYDIVYDTGINADPDFKEQAGFTCRNEQQYGLYTLGEGFEIVVPEARWQQSYRLAGVGQPWNEPIVQVPGVEGYYGYTRPYPGHQAWAGEPLYGVASKLQVWDAEAGRAVDRSAKSWDEETGQEVDEAGEASPYDIVTAEDRASAFEYKVLASNYLVSRQYGQQEEEPET